MSDAARGSRQLMLEAAETLLRERGLSGAGIHQIVARSGAPIGSLYYFFPGGKTELVAEALRIHADKAGALIQRFLGERSMPLPERLRRLARNAADGFERAGADKGCAIGAVTLDLDADQALLRERCSGAFDKWATDIAAHLPFRTPATRQSFAEMIVLALEGAFVLSRAQRSGRPFIVAGEWLAAMASARGAARRTRTPRQRKR